MTATAPQDRDTIDQLPPHAALAAMLASQVAAAQVVGTALPEIERAARCLADALAQGHCLTYAAAGSSGLMALSDGCELPGTFGIPLAQIRIAMAGGVPVDGQMPGDTEDDMDSAETVAASMTTGDVAVILSASGTTPYALAMARAARSRGAATIAIANTPNSALLDLADIAICLPTAPEVLAGSTRMGAGTAQKIALNMISTMAGIHLGHVHDGLMVNLNPDNIKLRQRAQAIVSRIAGVPVDMAQAALDSAQQDTKLAVLIAAGCTKEAAKALLTQHSNRLAPCLADIGRLA